MANKINQQLLQRNNLHATTLLILFLDEYGFDALQWDIETIKLELEADYKIKLEEDQLGRLAAIIQTITTDRFYTSLPDFIMTCRTVATDNVTPATWMPPSAYDIAATIAEIFLIDPPETEDVRSLFDPEIIAFITITLRNETILTPPDSLKFIPADHLAIQNIGKGKNSQLLLETGYTQGMQNSEDLQNEVDQHINGLVEELKLLMLSNGSVESLQQE